MGRGRDAGAQAQRDEDSFKTGDRVRFKDASWPPGLVSSSTGDGRLVVEVELMGRVVPIQLFPHQIEKALSCEERHRTVLERSGLFEPG
jgi:transcription antitermination factor NusG